MLRQLTSKYPKSLRPFALPSYLTRQFSISSPRVSASSTTHRMQLTRPKEDADISSTKKATSADPRNKSAIQKKPKSILQADAELRERLEQISGDGGAAGIEYEDGKPTAMKRSVRENMFRLI